MHNHTRTNCRPKLVDPDAAKRYTATAVSVMAFSEDGSKMWSFE